jgi:glycosyltransferase involved in cell wall biosynthesis
VSLCPDKDNVSTANNTDIFVIIPAFNEGPMLCSVLTEVNKTGYQIVVVDDGSTDDTVDAARRHTPHTLRHLVNRGQGAALQTGIEYAMSRGARIIATFDADGQHRIVDLKEMIDLVQSGACDVALGSRFLNHETQKSIPHGRRMVLRCASIIQRVLTGAKLTDAHNGLRVLSRKAADQVNLTNDRMAHASEIIDQLFNGELVIREYPVHIEYTEYSMSKGQSWTNGFRIMFHYIISRVFG